MNFAIRPLDVSSDTDVAQYGALDEALDQHSFGGFERYSVEQRRATLADSPYSATRRWVAVTELMEGGEAIAGRAAMFLPQQDNLDTVSAGIGVHPEFRGLGIGTALLQQALIPALRECGRSLIEAWAEVPAEGDPDDPAHPANRLAARLGVTRKNVAVARVLPLPIEDELLDRLQAEAREHVGDYRIELWDDQVPERHLEGYGQLLQQLELDEPDEDVEHEAPEYTPVRIRSSERRRRERGTAAIIAVAIAPDGTCVGNSEIHVQQSAGTTFAWQENTLVMPEHRGHRLGLALKTATHRLLRDRAPHLRALVTFNSHVNPWMTEINEQLGYRVALREVALQGRPDLSAPELSDPGLGAPGRGSTSEASSATLDA